MNYLQKSAKESKNPFILVGKTKKIRNILNHSIILSSKRMREVKKEMPKRYEDRKKIVDGLGSMGSMGHILWFLSVIFAVLGVIWDAMDITYGLTSMSWFLLAIVMALLSIPFYIGWAVAWYLKFLEK